MYDLLLKGGIVVDLFVGFDGVYDIVVEYGQIACIVLDIFVAEVARIIVVMGKIVMFGLIDLYVYVFEGVNCIGVNFDLGGVYVGVIIIVDVGSVGSVIFGAFFWYIMPSCYIEIISFFYIC